VASCEFINPYYEQLSGYSLDEVKGKEWFSTFLPERDQDHIREFFKSAVHELPVRGYVNPIVIRDGEEKEIEWFSDVMRDTEGVITGLLSIGQDVTERKRAEQVLQSQARIIDQINVSVVSTDLDGFI